MSENPSDSRSDDNNDSGEKLSEIKDLAPAVAADATRTMEEDTELPSDDSFDEFIKAHYLEVADTPSNIDYWIGKNKEILTRWQEEKAFVMQLEDDMTLREVFRIVINKRERTSDADMWFSSGIMTINRAFNNRFNMVCELVRQAKQTTELLQNDMAWDCVTTELDRMLTMTRIFQDEEGDFKFLYDKTRSTAIEFTQWRAIPENETAAAPSSKDPTV